MFVMNIMMDEVLHNNYTNPVEYMVERQYNDTDRHTCHQYKLVSSCVLFLSKILLYI